MKGNATKQKSVTDADIRQLVIARLRSLTSGRKISIGGEGEFSKEDLIEKVEKNDKIGNKIIEIQLEYLRSFKGNLSKSE